MEQKNLIAALLIAVVLLGGLYFFLTTGGADASAKIFNNKIFCSTKVSWINWYRKAFCPILPICENKCGNGTCEMVACLGTGCPCVETEMTCPSDCAEKPQPAPTCKNQCGNGRCEQAVCTAVGCPCPENKNNCPADCPVSATTSPPIPLCQNLWWHDNTSRICQQKQFCGAYMYAGLQTFSTQEQCQNSLKNNLN